MEILIGEAAQLPDLEDVLGISESVKHQVQVSKVGSEELKDQLEGLGSRQHLLRHGQRV